MVEDAPKKSGNEPAVDAITQPVDQNTTVLIFEILALFEKVVFDKESRIALLGRHAAPNFRHQQADIVIHAKTGSDVTGGGNEAVMAGQQPAHQGIIQINDGRERVEWPFGKCSFRPGAGGRRRFPGHAADELHEELG